MRANLLYIGKVYIFYLFSDELLQKHLATASDAADGTGRDVIGICEVKTALEN